MVLFVCEFFCRPTYPHLHTGGTTVLLCDSILWPNSLSRDLGIDHSQGISEHSWDWVSITHPHPPTVGRPPCTWKGSKDLCPKEGTTVDEPWSGVLARSRSETRDRSPDQTNLSRRDSRDQQWPSTRVPCPCGRALSFSPLLDSTWI